MVHELHLGNRVTISGPVPIEQVAEIMATVDLGVVPKLNSSFGSEAFSTKIMEFMAMNVPVIASRTRIDEYYFTDKMVQFFESGSAEDLAAKILSLMRNPERRAALCECSSEFIARNSWDVKKQGYLDLVDRLCSKSSPKAELLRILH
jgi:glycosyltransferase involved in cell wall biosynthesis